MGRENVTKQLALRSFVFVEWLDAMTDDDAWRGEDEVKKMPLAVAHAAGWLIYQDRDVIRLSPMVMDLGSEEEYERQHGVVLTIPRGMIRKVWRPRGVAQYRGGRRG